MNRFSTDELALLAAIHEQPREDSIRLIYADWLEEHDQAGYAEFIRLDIRGAAQNPTAQLQQLWCGALPARFRLRPFKRGLPCAWPEPVGLIKSCFDDVLAALPPRVRLSVPLVRPFRFEAFLQHSLCSRVDRMTVAASFSPRISRKVLQQDAVRALAACPFLDRMEEVRLFRLADDARVLCEELIEPRVRVVYLQTDQ